MNKNTIYNEFTVNKIYIPKYTNNPIVCNKTYYYIYYKIYQKYITSYEKSDILSNKYFQITNSMLNNSLLFLGKKIVVEEQKTLNKTNILFNRQVPCFCRTNLKM